MPFWKVPKHLGRKRKMKKIWKSLVSLLSAVVLLSAVFAPAFETFAVSLSLNKTGIVLVVGQSYTLKFNKSVKSAKWASSDKKIAAVSQKGVVKGIKKGSAVVSAKVGKKVYKCKVAVESPKISLSNATVKAGKTFTLKLNGTKRTPKWYTSDKKIATVGANGVVKTLKPGTVNVFARLGGKNYVCKLTVTKAENKLLTKKQIIKFFLKANKVYSDWLVPGDAVKFDMNDILEINGYAEYARVISNEYKSVSQLEKTFKKYFSEEIYKEQFDSYYKMHNGKMYGIIGLGEGGDVAPYKHKFILNKQTNNYCKFTIRSYYNIAYDQPIDTVYEMKKTNGKWLFINLFLGEFYSQNIKLVY